MCLTTICISSQYLQVFSHYFCKYFFFLFLFPFSFSSFSATPVHVSVPYFSDSSFIISIFLLIFLFDEKLSSYCPLFIKTCGFLYFFEHIYNGCFICLLSLTSEPSHRKILLLTFFFYVWIIPSWCFLFSFSFVFYHIFFFLTNWRFYNVV